jgi:hypothetical protein
MRAGDITMKTSALTLPEILAIGATRGMLGAGIALLLGNKLPADQREKLGWALVGIGVLSTFPLLYDVFSKREEMPRREVVDARDPLVTPYLL